MAEKKPYNPKRPEFDAYDKNASRRRALGDENIKTIVRGGGIQSADYVPGVSGWILLPNGGLKLGNTSGVFPAGAIAFADIQNIATARLLGRSTSGSGSIEQIQIGSGLTLAGGVLSSPSSAAAGREPLTNGDPASPELIFSNGDVIMA